jgi:hypothetical protein
MEDTPRASEAASAEALSALATMLHVSRTKLKVWVLLLTTLFGGVMGLVVVYKEVRA